MGPSFAVALVMFFYSLLVSGIGITFYLLQAFGLMRMLQSCGYKRPWYSFVPFCNVYALGELAEQYDDGKPSTKYGKTLLGLSIASVALSIVIIVGGIAVFLRPFTALLTNLLNNLQITEAQIAAAFESQMSSLLAGVAIIAVTSLAMSVIAVIYAVFLYIALYRVYRIFSPDYAVLCLLLSIFVSGSQPIILFVLRNKQPRNLRGQNGTGEQYQTYEGYPPQY